MNGETHIFVSSTLSDSGWTILATTSYKNLTARSSRLLNTFLVLCLVSMLIISTVTFAVSGSFTRPIRILQKAMKKAGNGDLTVRIEHHRTDEFGELNDGFNRLIDELRVLIQNISESRERENAAKYHMLQSQINPHFLYNTLDTIRMMAVLEDKDDIASALLHLSALFRYHVRESGKLVTVKEELEQTENYLYLQKLRHQEQLKILYRIDPAALAFKMPKILLQPLLENAFAHGFQDLERTKILTITVRKEAAAHLFFRSRQRPWHGRQDTRRPAAAAQAKDGGFAARHRPLQRQRTAPLVFFRVLLPAGGKPARGRHRCFLFHSAA